MGRTCLITGGAGNLSCQLSWHLASHFDTLLLADLAPGPVAPVPAVATYLKADVLDEPAWRAIFERHRPAAVIHLASLLSGSCERDRRMAWRINCDGLLNILELALEFQVGTLLFPSSFATYGGQLPETLSEDIPQWPDGLYGATKVAAERLGVYYQRKHGLDFRSVRLPMVVSRYAPPGAVSAYASRAFVEAAERGHYTFPVRPTTRVSLMYVEDALSALVDLLVAPQDKLTRRVYNVQSISPTAGEIAAAIQARLPEARLTFEPTEADVVERWPQRLVDQSARRDWGWNPQFDLNRLADCFLEELRRELPHAR